MLDPHRWRQNPGGGGSNVAKVLTVSEIKKIIIDHASQIDFSDRILDVGRRKILGGKGGRIEKCMSGMCGGREQSFLFDPRFDQCCSFFLVSGEPRDYDFGVIS